MNAEQLKWLHETLENLGWDSELRNHLANSGLNFEELTTFVRWNARKPYSKPKSWRKFFAESERSQFSLADWLKAFLLMTGYVDQKKMQSSTVKILGYIQCAAESPDAQTGANNLAVLVERFLRDYGFENR